MESWGCRWCAGAFPASKIATISSGKRIFFVCKSCLSTGAEHAKKVAKDAHSKKHMDRIQRGG